MPKPPDQIFLLQISDPHIGTSLMPARDTYRSGPRAGYNPHEHRLLVPLENAIRDARKLSQMPPEHDLPVVISGDLTQSGLENDYATALAIFHERWQWRYGANSRWIGFAWPREQMMMVPGNHDHWRHKTHQTAYSRGLSPDWFEPTPWRRTLQSTQGGFSLELFGVDSNSGLEDPTARPGKKNLFARGLISDYELSTLEAMLQETTPGPERIRTLVCHHAFSTAGGFLSAKPLEAESRSALVALAARHGVAVVLTGHTHSFHEQDWQQDPNDDGSWVLKELRCATTLQAKKRKEAGLQGFRFHRIARSENGGTEWTAWKYQVGAKFFTVEKGNPVSFQVPSLPSP